MDARHKLRARKSRGFTLLELLVVISLFTLISAVVATLFTRGHSVYNHGSSRIEMQRSGRLIGDRLTPYLASAFDNANPAQPPLLNITVDPNPPSPLPKSVRFITTEDWLSPAGDYPSVTTSSMLAPTAAALNTFTYEIALDGQTLNLNRLDVDGAVTETQTLRRPRSDELIMDESHPSFVPEDEFGFIQVRPNLLLLQFTLLRTERGDARSLQERTGESAQAGQLDMKERFRITFNLPLKR